MGIMYKNSIHILGCMTFIFGRKKEEVAGGWRILYNEELQNCTLHQMLLWWANRGGWDGKVIYSKHEWWEMHIIFWL